MWTAEIKKDCREIPTGLPAGIGVRFLEGIKGQLSDGYWENSPFMEGYWKFFGVEERDGEVLLLVSNKPVIWGYGYHTPNRFGSKDWRWILKWLADKAAILAREEAKSEYNRNGFKAEKGNKAMSLYWGYHNLTGNDVWLCVQTLKGMAKL